VEAAVIRAAGDGSTQVESRHLFPDSADAAASENFTFQEATRRFQANFLRETLENTEWNVIETSRRLDLARSHVYNLIRSFGLRRTD
jgi:transcriptional regulator of acetoin/glycerol metabolism